MSQEQQYSDVKLTSEERLAIYINKLKKEGNMEAIESVQQRVRTLGFGEFKIFLDKLGIVRKKKKHTGAMSA